MRYCAYCGKPLPKDATQRREYCNDSCREMAWRKREEVYATEYKAIEREIEHA